MQTIQQEAPSRSHGTDRDYDFYSSRSSSSRDRDFFEDELDSLSGFSSKWVLTFILPKWSIGLQQEECTLALSVLIPIQPTHTHLQGINVDISNIIA